MQPQYLRANFGYGFLAADIGTGDLSITLNYNHQLPVASGVFQIVVWNATSFPDPSTDPNVEIMTASYSGVTNTYNVVRAQESTIAAIHLTNSKVAMAYTAGVSNADMYFLGTKQIDETTISGSRMIQYDSVNDKLKYVAVPGGGDMLQSVYDPNNDGMIDDPQIKSVNVSKLVGTIGNNNLSGDRFVVSDGHIERVQVVSGGSGYVSPTVVFEYPGKHLFNNNFELWGAGVSVAPTGWTMQGSGATVAQENSIIRTSIAPSSLKITRVGADCNAYQRFDYTKNIAYWKGRTVTFGCWVYATSANRACVIVSDNVGSTTSSYHIISVIQTGIGLR